MRKVVSMAILAAFVPLSMWKPASSSAEGAGVKHWHGATENAAMTHIAVQGVVGGSPVDWMEHVTDEQYFQ